MEKLNIILDISLILSAVWMIYTANSIGKIAEKSYKYIVSGALILSIAHIAESFMFFYFADYTDVIELSHRLIVLIGFLLFILAFIEIKKTAIK